MKTDNSSLALVTGASGLVGAELVHQLIRAGRRVRAIYHTHPISFSSPLAESVSCDLLDVVGVEEIMQGVSEVYHCAGLISYVPEQKQRLYQVNVEATANVVNACLDAGVKKWFISVLLPHWVECRIIPCSMKNPNGKTMPIKAIMATASIWVNRKYGEE